MNRTITINNDTGYRHVEKDTIVPIKLDTTGTGQKRKYKKHSKKRSKRHSRRSKRRRSKK